MYADINAKMSLSVKYPLFRYNVLEHDKITYDM